MASSYSTSLRVELQANGENATTWGTKQNTSMQMLEAGIAGRASITHDDSASYTLTTVNGAADEARNMILNIGGTLTAARNAVVPTVSQAHIAKNATAGGYAVTLKTSGGTGIAIPNGKTTMLFCDGTNVVNAIDYLNTLTAGTFGVRSSGTGAYDLQIANSENLTASRALTLTLNDAARTVNLAGNLTLGGSLTTVGAFATTIRATAATDVTLPTAGTLGITLGTEQASTSGTSVDFTSIPSWARRIKIMFNQVSLNNNHELAIQLGDSGGVENAGYWSTAGGAGSNSSSTHFVLTGTAVGAFEWSGCFTLDLEDASDNTWCGMGMVCGGTGGSVYTSAGSKATSATLDRVRITTVAGTASFDSGSINISYER
jgi:hypothetical protein